MQRILVIDDDASVRTTITTLLEQEGFEVSAAEDGRAGLEALDSGLGVRALGGLAGEVAVEVPDMTFELGHALLGAALLRFELVAGVGQPLQGCGGGGLLLAQGGKRMGGHGLAGGGPGLLLGERILE